MIDMAGYYDFVLGLIPLALGGGSVALTVAGIDVSSAIIGGSLVAVALIGHGMFVRTPGADSRTAAPHPAGDGTELGAN